MAATAARRLGLCPTSRHLDRTSFHVDGRSNSDEEAGDQVIHITKGYSRDHRPELNQVMLDLRVEHQAGIPVLMKPLSGNSSDATDFGGIVSAHIGPLQTSYGTIYLVADRALYSVDNLQKLSGTDMKGITRVPATLTDAQTALAQADPQTMRPLMEGYRYPVLASTYGGVAQRWLLIDSEPRQPQAPRPVDKQLLKQGDKELKAWKNLCRTAFACEADARQALVTLAQSWQATFLHETTVHATARYGKRGRPGQGASPDPVVYPLEGTLASSLPARQALVDPHRCFLLATNELDETSLPPAEVWHGYKGQVHSERGFRFLKDPSFLACSLYLKKPERIMALLMVMTVCWLVYAALEYRIRNALKDSGSTFPNQKGQPTPHPTARWVFHYFVGIHLLLLPDLMQWPLVLNLNDEHRKLLRLLGPPYMRLYDVRYS
jgi:transposase